MFYIYCGIIALIIQFAGIKTINYLNYKFTEREQWRILNDRLEKQGKPRLDGKK